VGQDGILRGVGNPAVLSPTKLSYTPSATLPSSSTGSGHGVREKRTPGPKQEDKWQGEYAGGQLLRIGIVSRSEPNGIVSPRIVADQFVP
jgi:hypothetical protein